MAEILRFDDPGAGKGGYYRCFHSQLIKNDTVLQELAKFCSASPATLGAIFRFPTALFTPLGMLGRGSTGTVLSAKYSATALTREVVLKCAVNKDSLAVERFMLEHVRAHLLNTNRAKMLPGFPAIDEEAQEAVDTTDLHQHCIVLNTR